MPKLFLSSACTTLLITIPLYTHSSHYITKYIINNYSPSFQEDISHTIILWVHGTRFIKNNGFKAIFNKKSQLKNAIALTQIRYYRRIIDTLSEHYSLPRDNLYFFGWNGKLSNIERKKCASTLYCALTTLKKQYEKKYNISPKFIIMGHSHGGNVILHMASYHTPRSTLLLNKVVLLACPVQESMYQHLKSPLFKEIYVLYSCADLIQRLAPDFLKKEKFCLKNINFFPFSKRSFPQQDNLTQARILIDGMGPDHNDFVRPLFLSSLPLLLSHMKEWHAPTFQHRYIAHIITKP